MIPVQWSCGKSITSTGPLANMFPCGCGAVSPPLNKASITIADNNISPAIVKAIQTWPPKLLASSACFVNCLHNGLRDEAAAQSNRELRDGPAFCESMAQSPLALGAGKINQIKNHCATKFRLPDNNGAAMNGALRFFFFFFLFLTPLLP